MSTSDTFLEEVREAWSASDGDEIDERRAAVGRFLSLARRATFSDALFAAVARAALDAEWPQREAAARLLAAIADPRAVAALIKTVRSRPDTSPARYLGLAAPLPAEAAALLDEKPSEYVIRALMRAPSDAGRKWLAAALAEDSVLVGRGIEACGRWWDLKSLREVATAPRRWLDMPAWVDPDSRRIAAAHQIALRGDLWGIERLMGWARGEDDGDRGAALVALAELAWPAAVPLVAEALATWSDPHQLSMVTEAAGVLAAGALVEPLAALAARSIGPSPDGIDVAEGAAEFAELIAGVPPSSLQPAMRYRGGEPLTLAVLADQLTSRHSGPCRRAAHQLRAITGEDHGYDPELDLIANLDAIDAWQARARDPAPLSPGGWAWQGAPWP